MKCLICVLTCGLMLMVSGCSDPGVNDADPAGMDGPQEPVDDSAVIVSSAESEPIFFDSGEMDAEVALAAALKAAAAEKKRVLVCLEAPWCRWSDVLENFLRQNTELFAGSYIVLKIDIDGMTNGADVGARLRKSEWGGTPWLTILDGEGHEIINSDGPAGNIGCPITEDECAYFVEMIEKSAPTDPQDTAAAIGAALEKFASARRR